MKILKRIICFMLVILTITFCFFQLRVADFFKTYELYEILNERWDLNFSNNLSQKKKYGEQGGFQNDGIVFRILEIENNDNILDNFTNEKNEVFEQNFLTDLKYIEDFENVNIGEDKPNFEKEYRYFSKVKKYSILFDNNCEHPRNDTADYLYVFYYIDQINTIYFLENLL